MWRRRWPRAATRCASARAARRALSAALPRDCAAASCARRTSSTWGRGDWHVLLAGCDVVVNAVGILRERGAETYDRVHHRAAGALASACALGRRRLIHISALGLSNNAPSGFLRSKLAGERAVAASGAPYSIVRPSLLEGEGGFGARWLRWFARWPVHFVPANARGRIAVLDVADLGEAIAILCETPASAEWREVEVGGSE